MASDYRFGIFKLSDTITGWDLISLVFIYSPFDFYKSSEKNSLKSSFQINISRCILIYDIYEFWQLITKFLVH